MVVPISPNPFTRCKSANRPALALAAGVPVVADAIPSYRELAPYLTLDDWAGGLRHAPMASCSIRRRPG